MFRAPAPRTFVLSIIDRAQRAHHVEYRDGRIALTPHGDEAAHSIARSIGVPVE